MTSLFSSIALTELTLPSYLISTLVSLGLGVLIAFSCNFKQKCTQTMLITLVLLPAIVQTVIMMVNGNIGTGVAVAGAFSLVRFRSAQGNAKDIAMIFLSMAVGIATGTGYLALAVVFALIICVTYIVMTLLGVGTKKTEEKQLKITIPENLDYSEIFDDILNEYAKQWRLVEVKTTNMGAMYKLHYVIHLRNNVREKDLIDKLRCRNGNLEISCGRSTVIEQL